ncbi:hypothetical protein BsWGS_11244 [Bradybaena similaris]
MAEKRKCVVAVDGSHDSDYAFDWFCKHVHREGDHVILVYVPEIHSSKWSNAVYVHDPDIMESMLTEEELRIRADLEVFADKLKVHGLPGRVMSVMSSKPGEGIIKAAEDEDAALIVVGKKAKSSLKRTFVGSVSDYLVHHAHVPVFVCKQRSKPIPSQ